MDVPSRFFQTKWVPCVDNRTAAKPSKLSPDPFFVEKVGDIVGFYLNPPHHAIVLAVDEKSR